MSDSISSMNEDLREDPDNRRPEPEEKPRQVLAADGIVQVMYKTLEAVEVQYVLTPANLRGALHTMLHKIDKET